jgi:hypothetical protein
MWVAEARRRHAERLTILADPNAAGFYERNGAARIDEAPSGAVPAACCRSTRSGSIPWGDRDLGPHQPAGCEMPASARFPDQADNFPDGPI